MPRRPKFVVLAGDISFVFLFPGHAVQDVLNCALWNEILLTLSMALAIIAKKGIQSVNVIYWVV